MTTGIKFIGIEKGDSSTKKRQEGPRSEQRDSDGKVYDSLIPRLE